MILVYFDFVNQLKAFNQSHCQPQVIAAKSKAQRVIEFWVGAKIKTEM
jgi:hypothetical protein